MVRAENLALESSWAAAVTVLDHALSNLGEDNALREQRSITQSERAILMARARFLLVSRPNKEALLRANPDSFGPGSAIAVLILTYNRHRALWRNWVNNDLTEARQLTRAMAELDPIAASEHQSLVEARIDAHGVVLLEQGRLLHSQGFLREALAVWQEALRFKPGDAELQSYAGRAETFLRNLDQWGE